MHFFHLSSTLSYYIPLESPRLVPSATAFVSDQNNKALHRTPLSINVMIQSVSSCYLFIYFSLILNFYRNAGEHLPENIIFGANDLICNLLVCWYV